MFEMVESFEMDRAKDVDSVLMLAFAQIFGFGLLYAYYWL
jgi:hypothetical protein